MTLHDLEKSLESLQLKQIPHAQGSLFDHLKRVAYKLESWGLPPEVCLAAHCHSLYGTSYFQKSVLDLSQRPWLRGMIGEKAEQLVFNFSRMNRRLFMDSLHEYLAGQVPAPQLFISGEMHPHALDLEEAKALLHIWLANDLDHLPPENSENSQHQPRMFHSVASLLCEEACRDLAPQKRSPGTQDVLVIAGGLYRSVVHELLAKGYNVTICAGPLHRDHFGSAVERVWPRNLSVALEKKWHAVFDFGLMFQAFVPMKPSGSYPSIRRYFLVSLLREANGLKTPGFLSMPRLAERIARSEELWSQAMGDRLIRVHLADVVDKEDADFFLYQILSWILSNPMSESISLAPLISLENATKSLVDLIEAENIKVPQLELKDAENLTTDDLHRWMSPEFLNTSGISQAVSLTARRL